MTFTEALAIFRREVIAEEADADNPEGFTDASCQAMLKNASAEIAATLRFPKTLLTPAPSLAVNDTSFAAPADILDVELDGLNVGYFQARLASYQEVLLRRAQPAGPIEVFAFDPRRGGTIEFAPAASAAATVTLEYVQLIDPGGLADGDDIWGGLFPHYHFLVPLRAGVNAFNAVHDYETAAYFHQQFMAGFQAFAATLGQTDLGNLTLPPEARNDKGSVQA